MFIKLFLLEVFLRAMLRAPFRSLREKIALAVLHVLVDHSDEATLHTWMLHEHKY